MAESADIILPLLREMGAENKSLHQATAHRLDLIERRLKTREETQVSYRQALTADGLLSKLVTGEFEERIEALEKKVKELETEK